MNSAVSPNGLGVEITGVTKVYGDTIALSGLDLRALHGEILGVVGPNGAGKSTMIKILAGETLATSGRIVVDGQPWSEEFGAKRVAIVHQEPQLFPNLTVADNITIGREGTRFIRRRVNETERAVMVDLAIHDVADTSLAFVPLATQQRTEIARALVLDARVFLFDEPNSALTADESADLFRRMHALAAAGHVVILVSHRIAEVVAHCARVAVLQDGACRRVIEGDALNADTIAKELVIGHTASEDTITRGAGARTPLRLEHWSHRSGQFTDVNLEVRSGEIVGIVGVEGSGARELVRSIAGFEPGTGHIEVSERVGPAALPKQTGFVPADRSASLFGNMTIGENIVVRLGREIVGLGGGLRRDRMRTIAVDARERYQIKATSLSHRVSSLSGGNQQKLAIAEAMVQRPEVLVLEEPTRGVDIGSKREIYRHLRRYASDGHAIVMFCTETPELFEAADRVYVMSEGRLSRPLEVSAYGDVETLAASVTGLERHSRREGGTGDGTSEPTLLA